jgi:hypothetical protein
MKTLHTKEFWNKIDNWITRLQEYDLDISLEKIMKEKGSARWKYNQRKIENMKMNSMRTRAY